jgi:hypothetical protein
MAGLDDAGMDRANRDLVQPLALGGEEGIGGFRRTRRVGPRTVVEPGAAVGKTLRFDAVEVADRALEPERGRVEQAVRVLSELRGVVLVFW